MPETISREMLNALLPPGSIWIPKPGADLDLLFDGMADNAEIMRLFLASLADIRTPATTELLSDLEREFGIAYNSTLTDAERRAQLTAAKTGSQGDGTDTFMESKLQEAGFDLQVHSNEPPVDPDIILADHYLIYCDGDGGFAGHEDAICGQSAGTLVVNGGTESYSVPASSDYFHLIFFVGGDAVRNGVTDALESIAAAQVPVARADELVRLIVKYKPLHAWCGLIVDFV